MKSNRTPKTTARRFFLLPALAFALLATPGCLEAEDPVLGPGGFAGNPDGSTTTPGNGASGACTADDQCPDGKACTVDRCVEGVCTHDNAEGSGCEDGDKCTTGEVCTGGSCAGGKKVPCDDGSDCTADQCNPASGACVYPTIEGKCDDGNPCTTGDHCAAGKCSASGLKNCDDGNACTADSCTPSGVDNKPAGSCLHVHANAPCDDGNACTDKDKCQIGQCIGSGIACNDGNPCTKDLCKPETGCDHPGVVGPCDDGNKCTTSDTCDTKGACVGNAVAANHCDDGNPCTDDVCAPKTGCTNNFNTAACDDGNPCTKNDKCALGTCHKGAKDPKCACNSDKECQAFDKNLCDGLLICNLATNSCELDPKTVVQCDTGPCFKTTCITTTGKCSYANLPNGVGCDADDDKCTVSDACSGGKCLAGDAAKCDDGNVCTDDACDKSKGCLFTANTAACDDGNACTSGDACSNKACQSGLTKNCDDNNACTQDSCDKKTGKCTFSPDQLDGDPCDADGSVCTVGDVCKAGVCTKGKALVCDDKNPCTTDACNPNGGKGCQHTPNAEACSDGNPCTTNDTCKGGKCEAGALKACIDGDKCTTDGCDSQTGNCTFKTVAGCSTKCAKDADCQDNNVCTTDVCNGGTCSNKAATGACDDNSVCTANDTCKDGQCQGTIKNCNDGNVCTSDTCDAKAGCVTKAADGPCDADGSACTIGDACKAKACVAGGAKKCDDGKPCTKNLCDAKTGACSFDAKSLDGAACDADGSVCTHADTCKSGQCLPGAKLDCDDKNVCTADSCVPGAGKGSGCNHAGVTGPCDDGDKCTPVGQCGNGKCDTPPAKNCDDDNACTSDVCEKGSGSCKYTPIVNCAGDCKSKADCDDKNPCSVDTCEVGKCKHVSRTGNCADSNKCYLAGTCQNGVCAGAKKKECEDNNECTHDLCDGAKGTCNFLGNTDPCDDLNPCTVGDSCSFAVCEPGPAKTCDDKNKCTDDTCDKKTGKCVFTPNKAPCDDGNACSINDACDGGKCAAGKIGLTTMTIGKGTTGDTDGAKDKAEFNYPRGIWASPNGKVYVAGGASDLIREIDSKGNVTTFAGLGYAGYSNGERLKALFANPQGIVGDKQGNLYITDTDNHVIRYIDTKGVVNNFAGDGKAGMKDGYGIKAQLHKPAAMAIDGAGLYVTDIGSHAVYAVTLDGLVHRLAGTGKPGYKDDVGTAAQFDIPMGVAAAKDGTVYVADAANHRLRRISTTGIVSTIAGTGKPGKTDGKALSASFIFPQGLHFLANGALLIADRQNHLIRQLHNGEVTTVLGDGSIKTMYEPLEVTADSASNVWVVDSKNHRIVQLSLPARLCHDGNSCTADTCDKKTGKCGSTGLKNGTKCGDGCFDNQICKDAKCQFGTPKNCNDYNACTNDYCTEGVCKHVPIAGCT